MNVVNKADKITRKAQYELTNVAKREVLQELLNDILEKMKLLMDTQLLISKKINYMAKAYPNEVKELKKDTQTRTENLIKSGVRYKKNFTESVKLSENLTKFLKVENDSKMSISEIINSITKYIRTNKLQDPDNRKAFNPDENLHQLFESSQKKKTNAYTYHGIQKYIKPHLIY